MSLIRKNSKPGFTLIEIITVLFVLSLGLIGVMALIVQNIASQSLNKNNLIAYQLAQEGVELIRKTRDSDWRQGLDWRTNLADGVYYMDYRDSAPHSWSSSIGNLRQSEAGLYYNDLSQSGTDSRFSRAITLATKDADSFYVAARLTWFDHSRPFNYELETILYNWR